jgi:hypothetical protein
MAVPGELRAQLLLWMAVAVEQRNATVARPGRLASQCCIHDGREDQLEAITVFPAVIELSSAEYEHAKISIENMIDCVADDEAAVLRGVLDNMVEPQS